MNLLKKSLLVATAVASVTTSPAPFLPSGATAAMAKTSRSAPQPVRRPVNVLFIIADDLAPRLGAYGSPVQTPNIDRLAREGVTFDRAYTQFPWCGPSRASFLTGTRPDTTRVMDLATNFRTALPDIVTLPQYFKQNGYYSGRVGKIFHQGVPGDIGTSGMDDPQSWTEVFNPRGRDRDAENGRLKVLTPGVGIGSSMTWLDDDGADNEQTDGKVADRAIEMLRNNRGKPFFIAVGFYRPHVPMVAPKKYFEPYSLADMRIANETPEALAAVPEYTKAWTPDNFGMSEDEQRQMIRAYSASTSFVDAQVGRVLSELKALGLDDNTVVVFTSDHGYMLGEHGQWMKNILWEESDRIPLIVRAPGVSRLNQRSPRTVEILDLYPTLTDLAGLPHYPRNEGRSLVPLLKSPKSSWDRPALSQVRGGRSVRTERWRYTEWEEGKLGAELYDHASDPGEHHNLVVDPRYSAVVARLKAMLPKGPVEKRSQPGRYDTIRNCMIVRGNNPAKSPAPPVDGAGMKQCEIIDP